ncbi:NAD(P)/FAD-dependent oxidoreductase [Micromonospora echinofusca]|uniref:Dehydrogenase (Flavoprotein) n=1 Tax=Micromonospora echinofusca TaxID=47858 RepID=A0A1C5GGR6_MICEH|nr:FAD-dependent monooxygenase [Micromonospora echinofusca]SCG18980.1 Dehydrogenase (flavoprotein) [Micromonospora echinofusca]
MTTAVVLGGGFAGVLAAYVLAGHVDDVTIVESGRYPARPGPRPGLPQAHHNHVLVTGGARALDALVPGTVAALLAAGAHRRGLTGDALIRGADGWFHRHHTDAYVISCSRWLTDDVVRRRVLAHAAVRVREGTRVRGLTGNADQVTGVAVTGPHGTGTIPADLVVDATGRRSQAPRWLAALGGPPVREETVDSGLAYSTRVYRAPPGLGTGLPAIMLHPRTEQGREGHGATLFPIEGDRWIVTLTGTRGNRPPVTAPEFTSCAYALGSPIIAELLADAEPLGDVRPYRVTANRRRYFEHHPGPAGFMVLGDALATTNPVYSHGMSVAALGARALQRALARHGPGPAHSAELQAAVASEVDTPWRMAVGKDRGDAGAAPVPAPLRLRLGRCMLGDRTLLTGLFGAQTLIAPESAVGKAARQALAEPPPALLSTDDAIAQYPRLHDWWRSAPVRSTT